MNNTTEIIHKEHFEHWLFSQPDERRFNFMDIEGCLGCAFVRETTRYKHASFGHTIWSRNETPGDAISTTPQFLAGLIEAVVFEHRQFFTIADTKRAWLALFPETSTETLTVKQNELV